MLFEELTELVLVIFAVFIVFILGFTVGKVYERTR